jgi:PIN domain nuclease of toxin-antitoxin system
VRLLLDTHVLIWWDEGADLSPRANRAIRDAGQVYVSAVSEWEIAIKTGLGRLKPKRTVGQAAADSGFEELPVFLRHTQEVAALGSHHRDPFDRLLVCQARVERLTLVTRDPIFDQYDVRNIRA